MNRQPFDESELGIEGSELADVASTLESYVRATDDAPPAGLAARIVSAVEHEPTPRRGWIAALSHALGGPAGPGARMLALGAAAAIVVAAALFAGEIVEDVRNSNVGASPAPASPVVTPAPVPAPTPSTSEVPSPSPSPSASGSNGSPSASPSDVPTPSETDEDDNSGPGGGGGGGDSGPGGGGDNGPGGGGDSGEDGG